jgi:hypothetical protein
MKGKIIVVAMVSGASAFGAAAQTRVGPWNGVAYAAAVTEPNNASSYIVDNNGAKINDYTLSSYFFTNPATKFNAYNHMIFTFEACHSGGFIGDLATINGRESDINMANNRRSGIVVNTACAWNECSYFNGGTGPAFNNAFSYFPHDWQDQVANNGGGDVQMQPAFRAASQATVARGNPQNPQYYADSALANTFSLRSLIPGANDYAFLFAVKEGQANVGWEFFRDIERERTILINNYGWDDAHLIVMYGSGPGGTLPDNMTAVPNWVDYAATNNGLLTGLLATRGNVNGFSKIHWFSSSHGDSEAVPTPGAIAILTGGILTIARRRRRA